MFSKGAAPYAGMTNIETSEFVLAGNRLAKPEGCAEELYNLMLKCWSESAKERPTTVDLYNTMQDILYKGNRPIDTPVERKPDYEPTKLIYNT